MSKPSHHPLLPLGLALVLITVASLASFVPRASRPQGAPPDPKDVVTTEVPLSALPKGFNLAEDEKELDELRRQGFKVGKTIALRSVPKQSASSAPWEATLHGDMGGEVNGAYHVITDLDDGDTNDLEWRHKMYFDGIAIYGVANTTYGDDHWITNTGQSGYYIYVENGVSSPLGNLAKCREAIMPTLFALPDGGCRFTTTREMREWILDDAFAGAVDAAAGAFVPCLFSSAGASLCVGTSFFGYMSVKIVINTINAVVIQGCSGWNGDPRAPDGPTVYVDGNQWTWW